MARPWWHSLPLIICSTVGVLLSGALALFWVNRNAPDVWAIVEPQQVVAGVAYTLVGALLTSRRAAHRLGWLLLLIGALLTASAFSLQWAVFGLVTQPSSPAGAFALWAGLWMAAAGTFLPATFGLLMFPSGRLPDRWARIVAVLSAIGLTWVLLGLANGNTAPPGFPSLYERTPNPIALDDPIFDPGTGIIIVGLSSLLAVGLLLARFRAARGALRQQYKWVVLSMGLLIAMFMADTVARMIGSWTYVVIGPLMSATIALVPISMGIAILRYQLFDIDRVISRTLVYALLSASLIGVYTLIVVIFHALLDPVTGGGDLAVAATTLLVAALFRPLRSWIQRFVDKRFNRARYDANQTVEAFSATLRDEVDLEEVGIRLLRVVNATMQPAHVSIWVRPERGP
jgi:hypothetical protein